MDRLPTHMPIIRSQGRPRKPSPFMSPLPRPTIYITTDGIQRYFCETCRGDFGDANKYAHHLQGCWLPVQVRRDNFLNGESAPNQPNPCSQKNLPNPDKTSMPAPVAPEKPSKRVSAAKRKRLSVPPDMPVIPVTQQNQFCCPMSPNVFANQNASRPVFLATQESAQTMSSPPRKRPAKRTAQPRAHSAPDTSCSNFEQNVQQMTRPASTSSAAVVSECIYDLFDFGIYRPQNTVVCCEFCKLTFPNVDGLLYHMKSHA